MSKPDLFTETIISEILGRIADGESLRKICADEHLPCKKTVMNWLAREENEDLRKRYVLAREMQAESYVDEIIDIADDRKDDPDPQSRKVRCWARQWHASKQLPKKYGERMAHQALDENGDPAKASVIVFVDGVRSSR